MSDSYKTIVGDIRAETKVQGSRFIATAHHAETKGEAEKFIDTVRREFHDATHNCYAYRVRTHGNLFRFSDDGEPNGTAGKAILGAIDKLELTDIVLVVTRYFGGTKLGAGGLARAYAGAAEAALKKVEQVTRFIMEPVLATFPHAQIGNVMHVVSHHQAKIIDTSYDEDVHLRMEIRQSHAPEFKDALINATSGNIVLKSG